MMRRRLLGILQQFAFGIQELISKFYVYPLDQAYPDFPFFGALFSNGVRSDTPEFYSTAFSNGVRSDTPEFHSTAFSNGVRTDTPVFSYVPVGLNFFVLDADALG
jgi:hypothetical protein